MRRTLENFGKQKILFRPHCLRTNILSQLELRHQKLVYMINKKNRLPIPWRDYYRSCSSPDSKNRQQSQELQRRCTDLLSPRSAKAYGNRKNSVTFSLCGTGVEWRVSWELTSKMPYRRESHPSIRSRWVEKSVATTVLSRMETSTGN